MSESMSKQKRLLTGDRNQKQNLAYIATVHLFKIYNKDNAECLNVGIFQKYFMFNLCTEDSFSRYEVQCIITPGKHVRDINTPLNPTFI